MGVRKIIAEDIRAWQRHGFGDDRKRLNPIQVLALYWRFSGLRATVLYRISHALWRSHVKIVPFVLWNRCIRRYGLDIVPSVEIGPGLYIAHPVGTVIMARKIGRNLSITTSVTIGMRNTPDFPTLGDNVTIGAGARVLGNITLGDGANVGANAVVLTDVPAGATAVGIPAHILMPKSATNADYTTVANGASSH